MLQMDRHERQRRRSNSGYHRGRRELSVRDVALRELGFCVVSELGQGRLLADALGIDDGDPLHEVILERRDLRVACRAIALVGLELEEAALVTGFAKR